MLPAPIVMPGAEEAPFMLDILLAFVGTGLILLMAAYAELCERI